MPSTPPPTSLRARTPPTPLHGSRHDNYEPYSPRRSTRSTAQSNPYSSLNSERSPKFNLQRNITPPATAKKARFARAPTQFSSPPSSPASPAQHRTPRQLQKTPRKSPFTARKAVNDALSDSDHASSSLVPSTIDPSTMLPTPSKTPKKRQAAALNSTARILSFQSDNPNDVMPTPRKMKKPVRRHATNGFELHDEERESNRDKIQIFTDANARVPEVDDAEDNPFIGRKKSAARPQRRTTVAGRDMVEAARNDEGVVYVFRGRKIFRKFQDSDEERVSSAATDLSDAPSQRRLKRQAGAAAQRPLTRSAVVPRLLFPSESQLTERDQDTCDVDEEALTDIEMPSANSPQKHETKDADLTPVKDLFDPATPPPTNRATRSSSKKTSPMQATPIYEDEPESAVIGTEDSVSEFPKRKAKRPFDSWQRTKAGKKRAGDASEESAGSSKRTRSAAVASPA